MSKPRLYKHRVAPYGITGKQQAWVNKTVRKSDDATRASIFRGLIQEKIDSEKEGK